MWSGRRDEDVDREVAVESGGALERLRPERRLAAACLDDGPDQRAELVAPREAVVAEPEVRALGQDGDRRIALEARRLLFDAVRHLLRERGEAGNDPLRLGAEVDVARAGERSLFRAECDEQLDRPLERVEELAHTRLVLGLEDRHTGGL